MIRRLFLGAYAPAAILGIFFALLGLVLGVVLLLLPDPDAVTHLPPVTAGESAETSAVVTDFAFPPLSDFSEMVERPLFSEGRHYQAEDPSEEEQAEVVQTPLNFRLMGLIFAPDSQIALFRTNSGKYRRVQQGETINDWTLEELLPDRVNLSQGGETRELLLLKKKKKSAPVPEEGEGEVQEEENMTGEDPAAEEMQEQENGEEVSSETSDAEQSMEMPEGEGGDESATPSESLE